MTSTDPQTKSEFVSEITISKTKENEMKESSFEGGGGLNFLPLVAA